MPASKAQQRAVNKYMAANYDRINLTVPKGDKEVIKAHAESLGESVNGFLNRAIQETVGRDLAKEHKLFGVDLTPEQEKVIDCMYENEELFSDMLFEAGTVTHDFIALECGDEEDLLPDGLRFFSYDWFAVECKELEKGKLASFSSLTQTIAVDPKHINNESVILHEMIHLHEYVIDNLPLFYHDAILYCLYRSLKKTIPGLDDLISAHGHILNSRDIANSGGCHDVLFFLKSLDLDIKKQYKLGTVFGYGYCEPGGITDCDTTRHEEGKV